jgi:hypothetical protein
MAPFLRTASEGIITLAFAGFIYLGGNLAPIPDGGGQRTGNRKKRKRVTTRPGTASILVIQVEPPTAKKKKRNRPRRRNGVKNQAGVMRVPQTRASSRYRAQILGDTSSKTVLRHRTHASINGPKDPFPKISRSDAPRTIHTSLLNRATLFVEAAEGGPIYLVPRNDGSQIYIAKHLAHRHSVLTLDCSLEYLDALSPSREVRYYSPFEDHNDDFFVVINKRATVSALIPGYPFAALRGYAASSSSNDAHQVARQFSKVNRGFTSSMSMGQRADNGVPTPSLKVGSLDEVIVKSHDKATFIMHTAVLPWLGRPIVADRSRVEGFADEISPRNIVEASTHSLGVFCAWHCDTHNPPHTQTRPVICIECQPPI